MKLLLTGFEKFGDLPLNPSELVVQALKGQALHVAVLPTVYDEAGKRIVQLIDRYLPEAVLMTGVAEKRTEINLERFALNVDDAEKPDNSGAQRAGLHIDPEGPTARRTKVRLAPIRDALLAKGMPAVISNHAGVFVCNHTYYCALARRTPALFVHLPMVSDAWPTERMAEAVQVVIGGMAQQLAPAPTKR